MHRSFVPFLTRTLAGSGYHLGLFRIGQGKQHHYDFDIRVPLYVRGPGITGGTVHPNIGGNVDVSKRTSLHE